MRKLFSYKRSMFSKLPSRACDPSVPISPPTIFGLLTLLSKKIPKSYWDSINIKFSGSRFSKSFILFA